MDVPRLLDVTPKTLPLLEAALRSLADDLGDPYTMNSTRLAAILFAAHPAAYGALLQAPSGAVQGAALYSPAVSTVYGCAGTFVSDLWVAEPARGRRYGQQLLAYVAGRSAALWHARYIQLMVYAGNTGARRFYDRLGFQSRDDEIGMRIDFKDIGKWGNGE